MDRYVVPTRIVRDRALLQRRGKHRGHARGDRRSGRAARGPVRDGLRGRRQPRPDDRGRNCHCPWRRARAGRQVPPQLRPDAGDGRRHRAGSRPGAGDDGRRPAERSAGHRALPGQDRRGLRHRRRLALQPPGQAGLPQDSLEDRQLADRQGHRRTDQGQRLLAQGLPRRADQGDSAVLRDAPVHPGDGLDRGTAHCGDQGAPPRAPVRRSPSTACRASTRCCST